MSDIYLSLTETPTVVTLSQPVVSGVLSSNVTVANVVSVNVVTMPAITVQAAAPSVTTVAGSVSISNFPATQTIAGTVTANLPQAEAWAGVYDSGNDCIKIELANLNGDILSPSNPLPISGTVTANLKSDVYDAANDWNLNRVALHAYVGGGEWQAVGSGNISLPISGDFSSSTTMPPHKAVNLGFTNIDGEFLQVGDQYPLPVAVASSWVTQTVAGTVTVGNSVTIGSLPTLAPQLPRVTFIDGSGTVATANTAITVFASSSTRSYLLVQVTTGSAFVNVGATATTVNGINLTAGQGYAWETTIPQGIVSLISTTTSSRYVAKEA